MPDCRRELFRVRRDGPGRRVLPDEMLGRSESRTVVQEVIEGETASLCCETMCRERKVNVTRSPRVSLSTMYTYWNRR